VTRGQRTRTADRSTWALFLGKSAHEQPYGPTDSPVRSDRQRRIARRYQDRSGTRPRPQDYIVTDDLVRDTLLLTIADDQRAWARQARNASSVRSVRALVELDPNNEADGREQQHGLLAIAEHDGDAPPPAAAGSSAHGEPQTCE
jgi:hypothetical protein